MGQGPGLELGARRGICEGAGKPVLGFLRVVVGPNSDKLAGRGRLNEANGYQAGIDDEVKFDIAEGCHPFRPLDFCGHAGSIDRARGSRMRRKGKAPPARSTERLRRDPGLSIMGGQVCL